MYQFVLEANRKREKNDSPNHLGAIDEREENN